MLAAVLDTCVLYSGLRRDVLLSLAAHEVFQLVLTEDILLEIQYLEERKLAERSDCRTLRTSTSSLQRYG